MVVRRYFRAMTAEGAAAYALTGKLITKQVTTTTYRQHEEGAGLIRVQTTDRVRVRESNGRRVTDVARTDATVSVP